MPNWSRAAAASDLARWSDLRRAAGQRHRGRHRAMAVGGRFTAMQAERTGGARKVLDVVADRFRSAAPSGRAIEAIELALCAAAAADGVRRRAKTPWTCGNFSTGLHCPESDIRYADPIASMFSFNSAVGACETCRGFGRVIGVDWGW